MHQKWTTQWWLAIRQAFFFCAHISISTLSRFSEKLGFCSFGTGFLEIWNWVLPNLADFLKNFMGELGFWPFWNWVFGWELGFSKIWGTGFSKIPNWVFLAGFFLVQNQNTQLGILENPVPQIFEKTQFVTKNSVQNFDQKN